MKHMEPDSDCGMKHQLNRVIQLSCRHDGVSAVNEASYTNSVGEIINPSVMLPT